MHYKFEMSGRFLVSKLFDVTENSQLTDMYEHKPIRIPYGKGIVGYVAESGETVNIPDAYQVRCRFLAWTSRYVNFYCRQLGERGCSEESFCGRFGVVSCQP